MVDVERFQELLVGMPEGEFEMEFPNRETGHLITFLLQNASDIFNVLNAIHEMRIADAMNIQNGWLNDRHD